VSALYFLLPALFIVFVSFLIVRAGSTALTLTGLDQKRARFQALSAYSGTGFTTKETEAVVNHPQRRHIIPWLIVTTTTSFSTSTGYQIPINVLVLVVGIDTLKFNPRTTTGPGRLSPSPRRPPVAGGSLPRWSVRKHNKR
jgi:hypothetical protein